MKGKLIMSTKRLSVLLAILFLLGMVRVSAAAADEIKVIVNEKSIVFDQPPVIENGRTLVPLRAIFEALGAEVKWNSKTQTVTAIRGDITIVLTIGSSILTKNDIKIRLDVPAKLINGSTMIPVRAIAESFGSKVDWNANSRMVTITDSAAP